MTPWIKAGAAAIGGRPYVSVVLLMMLGVWGAAAEFYGQLIATSRRGDFVATTLAIVTVMFSAWLWINFLRFAHDLRQLRLPRRRPVVMGALSVILGLLWLLPCAVLALLHWAWRDLLLVTMGVPTGLAGALLWRESARALDSVQTRASAVNLVSGVQAATAWKALRIALGPPYSPAPWRARALQAVLLCAMLGVVPLLVGVFASSLNPRIFATLLHASELLSFLIGIGLCWVWPLSRAVALFDPTAGALSELALLPGLGAGRRPLVRLSLVIIGVPALGLAVLLVIALGVTWHQGLPHTVYWKLLAQFIVVPMVTLPVVLGHIAQQRLSSVWFPAAVTTQIFTFSVATWTGSWQAFEVPMWRWLMIGIVLAVAITLGAISIFPLRRILERPHVFMEV